jgi:hypothetical protein
MEIKNFPVPHPLWPGRFRLAVELEARMVDATEVYEEGVTKLKNFPHRDTHLGAQYDEWTFASVTAQSSQTLLFLWNTPIWTAAELAVLSAAQRARGRLIKTFWTSKVHGWPAVLEDLKIVVDNTNRNAEPWMDYRESFQVSSPVQIKRYLTDIDPTRSRVKCNEPITGEIRADYYGQTPVMFSNCLHPYVEVESSNPAGKRVVDCTPRKTGGRVGRTRIFRPTNHQGLKSHVFEIEVTEDSGIFLIEEKTVHPPQSRTQTIRSA